MDFKEINGTKHYLYSKEEFFSKYHYLKSDNIKNWRDGNQGDWVFTDDYDVCTILKKGSLKDKSGKSRSYVRTVCGSYLTNSKKDMIGEIAENIYAFSGNNEYKRFTKKKDCTSKENLFARYVASGKDVVTSYLDVYETKNVQYAKTRANQLLKQDRIQSMVKEEIEKVLKEENVSPNYIIERYKRISDISDNDTHVLKALDSLSKISGLFEPAEQKRETLTVWGGPSMEQIQGIENEQLIAHAEKETEEGEDKKNDK